MKIDKKSVNRNIKKNLKKSPAKAKKGGNRVTKVGPKNKNNIGFKKKKGEQTHCKLI